MDGAYGGAGLCIGVYGDCSDADTAFSFAAGAACGGDCLRGADLLSDKGMEKSGFVSVVLLHVLDHLCALCVNALCISPVPIRELFRYAGICNRRTSAVSVHMDPFSVWETDVNLGGGKKAYKLALYSAALYGGNHGVLHDAMERGHC